MWMDRWYVSCPETWIQPSPGDDIDAGTLLGKATNPLKRVMMRLTNLVTIYNQTYQNCNPHSGERLFPSRKTLQGIIFPVMFPIK